MATPPGQPGQDGARLFDYVLIVEIQTDPVTNELTPSINYRFPKQRTSEDDKFITNLGPFCFPTLKDFPKATMPSETFSFVLTDPSGDRRFGYCRRVLPPGKGKRFPICFCILSFIPCFSIFSSILDEVERRPSSAIPFFLEAILAQPFPSPGESIEVSVVSWTTTGAIDDFKFTRPDDNDSLFDYTNFDYLLYHMDPQKILAIFASLMVERRCIFTSDNITVLSECIQACVALLYPFSWQHVYIPVLPAQLLNYCCAPMPFIVGVVGDLMQEVCKLPCDKVLIVDLDRNELPYTPADDLSLLPNDLKGNLLELLTECSKVVHAKFGKSSKKKMLKERALLKKDCQKLSNGFITFFAELLCTYRFFLGNEDDADFKREEFLKNQPLTYKPLLEKFTKSQMFDVFAVEMATCDINNGAFEKHVTSLQKTFGFTHWQAGADDDGGSDPGKQRRRSSRNSWMKKSKKSEEFEISISQPACLLSSNPMFLPEQQNSALTTIIKQGNCYVQEVADKSSKKWIKHLIVLTAISLDLVARTPGGEKRSVPLKTVSRADTTSSPEKQYCIQVSVQGVPNTLIAFDSQDEQTIWFTLVSTWTKSATADLKSTAVMQSVEPLRSSGGRTATSIPNVARAAAPPFHRGAGSAFQPRAIESSTRVPVLPGLPGQKLRSTNQDNSQPASSAANPPRARLTDASREGLLKSPPRTFQPGANPKRSSFCLHNKSSDHDANVGASRDLRLSAELTEKVKTGPRPMPMRPTEYAKATLADSPLTRSMGHIDLPSISASQLRPNGMAPNGGSRGDKDASPMLGRQQSVACLMRTNIPPKPKAPPPPPPTTASK